MLHLIISTLAPVLEDIWGNFEYIANEISMEVLIITHQESSINQLVKGIC